MKFYDNNIVTSVREDRLTGASLRSISKKFNIPDTTIARWVYDIAVDNKKQASNRARVVSEKLGSSQLVESFAINQMNSLVLCSVIYWCEGSKYPMNDFVAFANSDELLVMSFIGLLRQAFILEESKLRVQLQLHDTHDENVVIDYWSKILRIPKTQFQKSTITSPKNKMKRKNYNGTCTIKYYDVRILWRITGVYELLGSKINGEMAERLKARVC